MLNLKYALMACFCKNTVCVNYWISSQVFLWSTKIKAYNWGDYVNLILAELISSKKVIPFRFHECEESVSMMGSILPWSMTSTTIVWGSGCLNPADSLWEKVDKPLAVCAVRGPKTREVLMQHGIDCPEVYGDPALLFPRFYFPSLKNVRKHKLGVVFHCSSIKRGQVWREQQKANCDILLINPSEFNDWHEFIDGICSCDLILSSSLHGIIIADAYHVPNVWMTLTGNEHPADNFKFIDYFLSVGKNIVEPMNLECFRYEDVEKYCKEWQEPRIDLDKLLSVCPFITK